MTAPTMTRLGPSHYDVLSEVTAERERQSQLWLHDDRHHLAAWHAIIAGRTGKLAEASLEGGLYHSVAALRDNAHAAVVHTAAVELAAVAVALAEQTAKRLNK